MTIPSYISFNNPRLNRVVQFYKNISMNKVMLWVILTTLTTSLSTRLIEIIRVHRVFYTKQKCLTLRTSKNINRLTKGAMNYLFQFPIIRQNKWVLSAAWERENGMKENSEIKGIPFKSKQLYLSERERECWPYCRWRRLIISTALTTTSLTYSLNAMQ